MKRLGCLVDDLQQIVFVVFFRRLAAAWQLDSHARGDVFDGLRKREPLGQREEFEDVAARAAAETVEEAFVAIDMKRRRFLAMKRTEAFVTFSG